MNPVESDSQWKLLREEDPNYHQLSGELKESLELPETTTPRPEAGIKETLPGKELKVEASLSAWLKPLPPIQDENIKFFDPASTRKPHFGRTPGDRPIIGLVAAHWNDNEPSHISPKWWDWNGIPNSTNKYKEDQLVSWHATPFEERLEKTLSEGSVITQRKPVYGKPIAFDENEESDTALSQLQSSTHPNGVFYNLIEVYIVELNKCIGFVLYVKGGEQPLAVEVPGQNVDGMEGEVVEGGNVKYEDNGDVSDVDEEVNVDGEGDKVPKIE
ncbi:protein jason [Quercus suber]|uniref:Protein jason n=1 Tax=Quercus suber TaxID=58331 RepID=A0AAW0JBY3_QUESU